MTFLQNQMHFVRRHFPENGKKWKTYLKIFLPIMLGSVFFALNGVVDNFMVGHINQGQAALGAINSWTGILIGFFMGTAAGGSVVAAQFYHAKKYDIVKEVARYRFYLCMIPAIILAAIAWTSPETLAKIWIPKKTSPEAYVKIIDNAKAYARVIAIQWILISLSFNYGNQLREIGYGKYTMMWGVGTLAANIALNATLMYGYGMGVEGAAWASVAGRIVAVTSGASIIFFKKIKIGFKPWTIFQVSWSTRVLIWKRWIYMGSIFTVTFFVIFRNWFYSHGYPAENGALGTGVSGMSVVALTGALMNIFTTTFSALASMSANFVGSELGKGNIPQAKINSDELKGFNLTVSSVLALMLIIFASCVPYMNFLAESKYDGTKLTFDGSAQLSQVSHALYVVCFYYPIWIWFSTSYRNGNAGGKGGQFALCDWITSALQLAWLAMIVFALVPNSKVMQENFWITYVIFFISDFSKLIWQEILYYKYNWLKVLTKEEATIKKEVARDHIQAAAELPNEK